MREAGAEHRFDVGRGVTLEKTCSIGWAAYPFLPRRPAAVGWQTVVDIADACLCAVEATSRNAWLGVERSEARGGAGENGTWGGTDAGQVIRDQLAAGGLRLSTSIDPETQVVWD